MSDPHSTLQYGIKEYVLKSFQHVDYVILIMRTNVVLEKGLLSFFLKKAKLQDAFYLKRR